jgi:hypothetical protein
MDTSNSRPSPITQELSNLRRVAVALLVIDIVLAAAWIVRNTWSLYAME